LTVVRNCNLPEELYYIIEKHVWARPEDGVIVVGMTDVAQNLAKTIISVTPKSAGRPVAKGKSLATVESSKWVGPVPSPVSGEIVEVNGAVVATPSTLNEDPYGAGWIAKVAPADWEADSADLVTGAAGLEAYESFLKAEGIECEAS
jgi:glycine cleavage system H protein